MKRRAFRSLAAFTAVSLSSCATYTSQTEKFRQDLYTGQNDAALKKLDDSSMAKSNVDFVLYRMERGMALYLNKQYAQAALEFSKAQERAEELYTTSLSNQATAMVTNDSFENYEGEAHERVLLGVYSAMAYFANNEPAKVRPEVKKIDEILTALNEKNGGKNNFTRESFAHYLAGFVYESRGEWDAAIVEYRASLEAIDSIRKWSQAVSAVQIANSLGRIAEFRKRKDMIELASKFAPIGGWGNLADLQKSGEVLVVFEAGKSPLKHAKDVMFPFDGRVLRISYPVYNDAFSVSPIASVTVDGKYVGETQIVQDVGALARQSLEDRRLRTLTRMAVRVALKDQTAKAVGGNAGLALSVLGAVTETADTRSWTTLPNTLQTLRIPVQAGKDSVIRVSPLNGKPQEFTVKLGAGEKKFIQVRAF